MHVADFVQPNFYSVNLKQAFGCLTCIVYFDYFHSEQPFCTHVTVSQWLFDCWAFAKNLF